MRPAAWRLAAANGAARRIHHRSRPAVPIPCRHFAGLTGRRCCMESRRKQIIGERGIRTNDYLIDYIGIFNRSDFRYHQKCPHRHSLVFAHSSRRIVGSVSPGQRFTNWSRRRSSEAITCQEKFYCFVFIDIFLNPAAGRPLQLSRRSTTEHHRVPQKSHRPTAHIRRFFFTP